MSEDQEGFDEEAVASKLRYLRVLKRRGEEIEAERRSLQQELVDLLETFTEDEKFDAFGIRASVVRPVRTTWDEDALQEVVSALPGNVWIKITKRVLDKDKLEAQVKRGAIKLDDIEDCAVIKPTAPWIKVDIPE